MYEQLLTPYRDELGDEFLSNLAQLLREHNSKPHSSTRRSSAVLSDLSQRQRAQHLAAGFVDIRRLGYKIQSPNRLKRAHAEALIQHWKSSGVSNGAIQNRVSAFRALAKWLNKPTVVPTLSDMEILVEAKLGRARVAQRDRSWSGNGVDVGSVLEQVRMIDARVAIQLELQMAFGLRRKEAAMLIIESAIEDMTSRLRIQVVRGTKGGRAREVQVSDVVQLDVLLRAELLANGTTGSTIPSDYTLDRWRSRYYYVMRAVGCTRNGDGALGVTSHGLRHEYLHRRFEQITGLPAPVKAEADRTVVFDSVALEAAMRRIVSDAGHSDKYKASSYLGSMRVRKSVRDLGELLSVDEEKR